ncbi:nucleoid-associated protein [Flavobacterium sp. ZT3P35]|uniref:nucleoid-associated protein n=2 Tax=unclassified Flavobacterium TaxID=196869 RepID=UPI003AAC27FF
MTVINIVFHHIIKELKGEASLKCSDKLLPINQTVNEFVAKLIKNYSSKNPTQGTFQVDSDNYPFQNKVESYLTDGDFLEFTQESMKILERAINISTTTGGYVVFVHYTDKSTDYLITAMLDKSVQFTVNDENLDIEKLKTLDVDKLARANRLNIKRWKDKDVLYLSFIKGTRAVSNYFIDFIGSTDITSSKDNFNKLKDATNRYFIDKKINSLEKNKIKDKFKAYFDRCFEDKKDAELESISSLINDREPRAFLEFVKEKELEVSGKIAIHRKTDFDSFVRNRVYEPGYTLVFDESLKKTNKIMRQGNQIIINDVPDNFLNSIFDDEKPT